MSRVVLVLPLALLLVACDRDRVEPAHIHGSSAPSAIAASGAGSPDVPSTVRRDVVVNMQDACDPETFNAALRNPEACVRRGGVTFDQFIAELTRLSFIGPWRFAPSTANVRVGETFVAINRGGESHTFTEVAEFGGGNVALLNRLANLPNVAPECPAAGIVPAGGTHRETVDQTGKLKFQCCIHPWMRLEASSR